ncbi:DUF2905 domain-containing protein [Calditerrivibrio nitroreducens]|uniref:DUF2905 domain-containing protein n=1 Tax=Calditerrivibrio nitroreducens (strain DSM 19672 / NBRC 101217 / Yu37-1) TaxID=768670 RepID=E4TIC1_CALNY|nr:DUF2905 domain-containing protein [Calditerrivibrio nitroreducens]ADR17946.1 hypothetical protein Calni_0030 [Calditerrivibrio nitroreducens DSM 19672]
MDGFSGIGKILIFFGLIMIAAGIFLYFGEKFGLGKLPGDIYYKKGDFTFYFPIVTSIVISIILTIVLNIFFRK